MVQENSVKDPWSEVGDLFGDARYRTLGILPTATAAEVRKAYRKLIRTQHPDKGGSAAAFAAIQEAFQVLSNPGKRDVYDAWGKELRFRYVQGVAAKAHGGESILLDQLAEQGLHCDSGTQLVVVCEVCARPATKDCWTCGMKICDFCTLKRHWKGAFPLHWPLINSDHMRTQLAKRELEKKRIEDAHRLEVQDPNFRHPQQRREIDRFQEAACKMASRPDRLVAYDHELARFYMWAQTDSHVFIVCEVPTGHTEQQLLLDCTAQALVLQALGEALPVIERTLDRGLNATRQLDTYRTPDNRQFAMSFPKEEYGAAWQRLFRGDSDGVRCLQLLYSMTETDDDVTLEYQLPFWIEEGDCDVCITATDLTVLVRNELAFRRTYWRNREEEERSSDYAVVDVAESLWYLDEGSNAAGQHVQQLIVTLVKPALTADEVRWRKGKRMDNRAGQRPGGGPKGVRFFVEDEDEFGLEDMLQALCFNAAGTTWVPAKPGQDGAPSKRATDAAQLSSAARRNLELLSKHNAST